ncbi:MAG: glycosyltransferase family 2 protein [Candidatus Accumulibacter sp.]|uniref:glycosyltransferase family 2 protein n=1 Tax=Accumulibacter sp. TaxID=2053492 RepID=UPI0028793ED6|nr:glycosyltransferase family 2 protein [Accumulibacter sp.]MDS4013041.1 glycosyltransferase family 2 protein [Accumulibacter sp.]
MSLSGRQPKPAPLAQRRGANAARPRISCVVPALNEQENLCVLLPCLETVLASAASAWEVVVVDDGSSDLTSELMEAWVSRQGFRYLQLSRNFGKEAALSAGLAAAAGDVVVCLDADLQHPPALIPQMLDLWREGADMVCAVRSNRDDESPIKRFGAWLLYHILGSGHRVRIPADAGDFRLLDRAVVSALLRLPERTRFMKGLFAWVGFVVRSIEYEPAERLQGKTHFSFFGLVEFALDGITAFSTWPLRVLTLSGFSIAALAFAYGLYLVVEYLLVGNQVSGWTTIVTAMLFLSGVHLLGLGVIGAYLAQVFNEVKQRPVYLLRRDIGNGLPRDETDGFPP